MTQDEFMEDTGRAMGIVGSLIVSSNPLAGIALNVVPKVIDLIREISHQTGASHSAVADTILATMVHFRSLPTGVASAPGAMGDAIRSQGSA